jgi:hypothetical protein
MQQCRKLIWQKEGENFRMVDLIIPSTLIYLKLQELTGLAFTGKTGSGACKLKQEQGF